MLQIAWVSNLEYYEESVNHGNYHEYVKCFSCIVACLNINLTFIFLSTSVSYKSFNDIEYSQPYLLRFLFNYVQGCFEYSYHISPILAAQVAFVNWSVVAYLLLTVSIVHSTLNLIYLQFPFVFLLNSLLILPFFSD